jgi:exopolysaccharide biosynthesis polyprenyl glycosylphosphotransferase
MLETPLLKAHAGRAHTLMVAADLLLVGLVFYLVLSLPGAYQPADGMGEIGALQLAFVSLVASVSWPLTLEELGLYQSQRRRNRGQILLGLFSGAVVPTVVLAGMVMATRLPVSPLFPLVCGAGQALALGGLRLVIFTGLHLLRRRGRNTRNLLIVGSGPRATRVFNAVERHPDWGLRVIGFVDDADTPVDPALPAGKVHKLVDFPELMKDQVVDEIVIACPRSMLTSIEPVVAYCAEVGVPIMLLADLFGDFLPPPRVTSFDSMTALSFAPVHHSLAKLAVKRVIDLAGASLLLALCAPVIGVAALVIRATSPGPALFRQVRLGLNGRRIEMLKLRTMYADAEERLGGLVALNEMDGPVFKVANDPRVTPVGRFLRRWSFDETPQLWNVLKGEMSLVGPRPPLTTEVEQYASFERRRLSMRPGITCLWQVSGRNTIGFADWVKLDLEYIDSWTLSRDLTILLKTLPAVIRRTGAS